MSSLFIRSLLVIPGEFVLRIMQFPFLIFGAHPLSRVLLLRKTLREFHSTMNSLQIPTALHHVAFAMK
jgi:hypothetical protein